MQHPNKEIMQKAIDIAKERARLGSHPIAAIIVKDDKIIAYAYTTTRIDNDPTCHAEMNAIRKAARSLGTRILQDCYLYVTYEPCPMCTAAAVWAKMKGIVFGLPAEEHHPDYPYNFTIRSKDVIDAGTPKLELFPEFMKDECRKLME
jgi:tRNA(Arg) A34 adenosine deaminase TadA